MATGKEIERLVTVSKALGVKVNPLHVSALKQWYKLLNKAKRKVFNDNRKRDRQASVSIASVRSKGKQDSTEGSKRLAVSDNLAEEAKVSEHQSKDLDSKS